MIIRNNGEPLGQMLTREEFIKLDPNKVYNDLLNREEHYLIMTEHGAVAIETLSNIDDDDVDAAERFIEEQAAAQSG